MSIDDKDRSELIRYRMVQAEETISDVELLIENDRLRSAVNRLPNHIFCIDSGDWGEVKSIAEKEHFGCRIAEKRALRMSEFGLKFENSMSW